MKQRRASGGQQLNYLDEINKEVPCTTRYPLPLTRYLWDELLTCCSQWRR